MMKRFTPIALCLLSWMFIGINLSYSQTKDSPKHNHTSSEPLLFIKNKNQWNEKVLYRTYFEGNASLFIENQGFTYLLTHPEDIIKIHDLHKNWEKSKNGIDVRHHAYKVNFLNSKIGETKGIAKKNAYYNYFVGQDSKKWAPKVPLYGKVSQKEIYEGIQLEVYSQHGHLKYDFIVAPNADANQIALEYKGADDLRLDENGNLIIETSIQSMIEMAPIAWQIIDGKKVDVKCEYELSENVLRYVFPNNYNPAYELIIDPSVVASTLSGTVSNANFGHCATFDNAGNIYSGGRSFGTGYPTTNGAFQLNYGGGGTDICISKYNANGSDLIYATYIGGINGDLPHSIIADFNQQLYIYGSSSSNDYPVTDNAFQKVHGGLNDIVVSILSPDGSDLVGSSYYGGSQEDGVNGSSLNSNYGDNFRGEIILDSQNNVYVVSSSRSENFPTTAGAYDTQKNNFGVFNSPAQDVVVMKANSDLSLLYWATFLGGNDADIGNGLRLDDYNNVYVTGTAGDANFPTTDGAFQQAWPGGEENSYVAKLSSDGSTLLASTFFGSNNGDEHSYFIDIDEDSQVHIYGQTTGTIPISPNTYSNNPGSLQFLAAFGENLTTKVYSTVIGTGPNFFDDYDFVPVAFLVDKCNGIYLSGYYAVDDLPTTTNSFSNSGDAFYLAKLEPNAAALEFGTYYGNADHVDGGTSRFDKGGVVYQGVCSCTSAGLLNTLPNAWATSQTTFCDVGVFKIDFDIETVIANGIASPSTSGCAPYTVDFEFTGQNASEYDWKINNQMISNNASHTYTFNEAGSYDIELVVRNPITCNLADTFLLTIDVLDDESVVIDTAICSNENLFLDATTANANYQWQDGSTGATYLINEPGIFWVDIDIEGCSRRDSFNVETLSEVVIDLGPDTSLCDVNTFALNATDPGVVSYSWFDGSSQPIFEADSTGNYWIETTDTLGCISVSEVNLIFGTTPEFTIGPDTILCDGDEATLNNTIPDYDFQWQDGSTNNTFTVEEAGLYWLEINNDGCINRDSIEIAYYSPIVPNSEGFDISCANDCNGMVYAAPDGGFGSGYLYSWETGDSTNQVENLCPGTYNITVTDGAGCTAEASALIDAPLPLEMFVSLRHVECPGENDGAIEVSEVNGGVPPYTYAFETEIYSDVPGLAFLPGGPIEVFVQDINGCTISETFTIEEPEAYAIYAGEDILLKLGEETELEAQIFPYFGQDVLWEPDTFLDCPECPTTGIAPTETTLYTLTVINPENGCLQTDSILVRVDKPREVYIPNVFSPDNNGTNDFFSVFVGPGVESITDMKIFDRWGNQVYEQLNFQGNNPEIGWDGNFRNKKMDTGVYTYFFNVLFKDGVSKMYEGSVTLLR